MILRNCREPSPTEVSKHSQTLGQGTGPFILTTDWSKQNITGVLSQVQDGQERFLRCCGRKCNKYKKNYQSFKGELLVMI